MNFLIVYGSVYVSVLFCTIFCPFSAVSFLGSYKNGMLVISLYICWVCQPESKTTQLSGCVSFVLFILLLPRILISKYLTYCLLRLADACIYMYAICYLFICVALSHSLCCFVYPLFVFFHMSYVFARVLVCLYFISYVCVLSGPFTDTLSGMSTKVRGHQQDILCSVFCPPDAFATSDIDGNVLLWSVDSGYRTGVLKPPPPKGWEPEECTLLLSYIIISHLASLVKPFIKEWGGGCIGTYV